ncbi:xylulokinase [Arenicella xantha]|uniref:Xylulose kinase n=1 Tax=Arenicella xantha TaxID=644221 RepID=A0A395JLN3_9GAMM|nr:xylulokinase [Arenicella xantha]RBP51672.1 xylulokinase [Arenicella xantha]
MRTTLGIDLGTQNIKVIFYDFELRQTVASASSPLNLYQDDCGTAEQQAHWWTKALRDALSRIPQAVKQSVIGIGVSGQQHGFVPLDKHGEVLAPVKLWCDTSTEAECQEIMERMGGVQRCIELTGNKIVTGYTASKVLGFKHRHAEQYKQLDTILLPHDYLNFWLTGEKCMEMGDASGTGFLNVKTREWCPEVLQAIDPDRDLTKCLPTPRINNEIIGSISTFAAEKTGLPVGTPVSIGGGDNMMGALGTGNITPGNTTISLGTSGTVFAYSDQAIIDDQGNIAAFCSSTGGWMPLLCTMNCTVTTELLRSMLDVSISDFDNTIALAPAGSNGVITLPFFNGERTPNLPTAKGCVLGLDSQNTNRENVLRSGAEGATFALKFGIDELHRLGLTTRQIVLTGGATKSAVWRQIVADITGVEVNVLKQDEGAAFGSALQALCAVLNKGAINQAFLGEHYIMDPQMHCEPSIVAGSVYAERYQQYLSAVKAISAIYQ